ncbi:MULTISPECIES: hypothetical protein [unclassified Pseudomonas]|uniref:hypothetical protein n=1 Tax=unclassified Pseudomonas TaxID=196821 RepID=UPI000BA4BC3E|nr:MULTISPECIES: hypothetical protein [unclassified Pseudomonas]MCU1723747.1 hypothetical protein [Pseudomonas sp. 5P_5.1_Bac1]
MTSATTTPLSDGTVQFVAHWLPPLMAGDYSITVTQHLQNTDPKASAKAAFDEAFVNSRRFAVRGERFSLNPDELVSRFPPADNQGEYQNVLPHVIFARRTLPWERSPELEADNASWLALLLFETDEAPTLQSVQAGDLQRQPFYRSAEDAASKGTPATSTLPATTASYPDGYALLSGADGKAPAFTLSTGENWWDLCQVIDVPADLFAAIAPTLDELDWLAHARSVSLTSKQAEDEAEQEGSFSVVVGNRLPAPNRQCVVHLVSLEGLARFLPTGDGETAAPLTLASGGTAQTLRLVSLANWKFTSLDPQETFSGYLEAVDCAPLRRPAPASSTSPVQQTVANAFAMGYTALNHHTRLGDDTVSWLRGPLLPFASVPVIVPPPAATPLVVADQAVSFDPATGLMDVTYAAAWQIGRGLGLQNNLYASTLYGWKRNEARAEAQHSETLALTLRLHASVQPDSALRSGAAAAPVGRSGLRGLAIGLIAESLSAQCARSSSPSAEQDQ